MIVAVFITSCEDFLNESPDERIEADDLDKAAQLLVGAYPGTDYLFTDWFTDDCEYISTNIQDPLMTDAFYWRDLEEYDDNCSPSNYWYGAYSAIAQANAALEALEKIDSEDTDYKNAIKGEALVCRAYAHFMIASLFCDNYDESTAKTNLGIPYVSQSENVLIQNYTRGSLEETYKNIETDLVNGMKLLSDNYYSGSKKYHFTISAAIAFANRFYLYKNDYENSIKYANKLLGEETLDESYIKNMDEYDTQSGALAKRTFYVNKEDASNILIIEKTVGIGLRYNYGYRTSVSLWSSIFGNSPWGRYDIRNYSMGYYGDGDRNTIRAPKFTEEFYKESLTSTTGYPFFVHPVFRGEELIFNRAECNILLGNYDKALSDLNAIGTKRHKATALALSDLKTYYSTDNDVVALLYTLIDEKRKEFLQEGMNWFDIKRFGLQVAHYTFQGEQMVLSGDDSRKILQIPLDASNRGLKKNQR